MRPFTIFYACAERWPFVTTGGLGEVAYSFPLALARRGHRVTVLLPAYGDLRSLHDLRPGPALDDPALRGYSWREGTADGLRHLFLSGPALNPEAGGPYTDAEGRPAADLHLRFALFSRACAERADHERAEILHLNDWHTAPAAALVRGGKHRPRTLLTVHNFRYRGETSTRTLADLFPDLSLPAITDENPPTFLGIGVATSDIVQTVSPSYAAEVLATDDALARGLRARPHGLVGIVNGLDTQRWDPRCDPALGRGFGPRTLAHKHELRRELAARWGFPTVDNPLAVYIGRLVHDKGIDLLLALLCELGELGLNLAILGRGDPHYETILRAAPAPEGRWRARLAYDDREAHWLLGAADLLLMPSRHEPCGLVQLEALRYGAIPVVCASGGLRDTVIDVRRNPLGNGFVFADPTPEAFIATVRAARNLITAPELWTTLVRRAMTQRLGWARRIPSYEALYRRLSRA